MARDRVRRLRRRVYQVLEQGPVGDRLSKAVDRLLVALILINLIAVALESMPEYQERYATAFALIEYFSLDRLHDRIRPAAVVRSRARTASASPPRHARLKYVLSPAGIVDLVAVLPFWFAMIAAGRSARGPGFPDGALLQVCALFARDAVAARRALSRARARCSAAS